MNILLYGPLNTGSLLWFAARNLEAVGHKAQAFDFTHNQPYDHILSRLKYKFPVIDAVSIAALNRKFSRCVLSEKPELVIVCKGRYLLPEAIRKIRKSDIKIVNWYPDGVTEIFRKFILETIPEYDLFFTKEPYLARRLAALGLDNIRYLPHCCDPEIHRPMELSEADKRIYSCDLSIVGSWYPYRQEMISPLSGYDFKIWGKGWGCAPGELKKLWQGKEVVGNEQALAFNATDININTSHLQDVEGVNQRVFDIAGCGAFQLSPWQSDLPNLFDTQKEIIPYKNKKELKDLVDYYLKHENERREIARRAQEKAYREHTYKYRLRQILSLLKIE